jgi:uncharacterized membrane protein YedE/YeeE
LIELLNELRVVLPGVQVLFAFLLAVPFSRGYPKVTEFEKITFFVSLLATAVSSALLIATPSFHRLRFQDGDKQKIIRYGNRFAIAGIGSLAVAMVAAVLMVTSYLFGVVPGIVTAAAITVVIVVLWYGIALGTELDD